VRGKKNKRCFFLAVTQNIANKALEYVEKQHGLTNSDAQALYNALADAPDGSTAAVEYFLPNRLEIPAAYVSGVLLECSKVSSASPEEFKQIQRDITKDEMIEALDFVLATSLMLIETMLKKPRYEKIVDIAKLSSSLNELVPEKCGPMSREVLTRLKPQLQKSRYEEPSFLRGQTKTTDDVAEEQGRKLGIQIMDDEALALSRNADKFRRGGNHEKAIEIYKETIRIQPDFYDAHTNLGIAYFETGRIDDAIAEYSQALLVKPDYIGGEEAHINFVNALKRKGLSAQSINLYKQVVERLPENPIHHSTLGYLYEEAKMYDAAAREYEVTLSLTETGEWADMAREGLQIIHSQTSSGKEQETNSEDYDLVQWLEDTETNPQKEEQEMTDLHCSKCGKRDGGSSGEAGKIAVGSIESFMNMVGQCQECGLLVCGACAVKEESRGMTRFKCPDCSGIIGAPA